MLIFYFIITIMVVTNFWRLNSLTSRIGITFDVFGDNSTTIKANYGRYHDMLRITGLYQKREDYKFEGMKR